MYTNHLGENKERKHLQTIYLLGERVAILLCRLLRGFFLSFLHLLEVYVLLFSSYYCCCYFSNSNFCWSFYFIVRANVSSVSFVGLLICLMSWVLQFVMRRYNKLLKVCIFSFFFVYIFFLGKVCEKKRYTNSTNDGQKKSENIVKWKKRKKKKTPKHEKTRYGNRSNKK